MSDMLKVAEEIEEKLNKVGLAGSRIGSGFNFVNNSRTEKKQELKLLV